MPHALLGRARLALAAFLSFFLVLAALAPAALAQSDAIPDAQEISNLSDYAGDAALTAPPIAPKATPASPPTAFGGLTFFTDRPTFDAATGPLPTEAFEGSNVPSGNIFGCDGPLNSATDDACYSPGAVIEGFTLNAFGDSDTRYATVAPGALGAPSTVVGPDAPDANAELLFSGSPTAVGFDLSDANNGASFTIEVFGTDGSLVSTVVNAPVVSTGGTFVGVTSMTPITRVTISDPVGTAQSEFQLIDNLTFGVAVPTCPETLILSDFSGPGNRFQVRNVGTTTINPAGCTFVATNNSVYVNLGLDIVTQISPNSTVTVTFGLNNDFSDAFSGLALVDRPSVPNGTPIADLADDIVTALVYTSGDVLYGFSHRNPALEPRYCDDYTPARYGPFARLQCSPPGTAGPGFAALLEAAGAPIPITFRVNGSVLGLDRDGTAPDEVLALRGSTFPLSLDYSFPLTGPDADGIWTGTFNFSDALAGPDLEYEFVRHLDTQYDLPAVDLVIAGGEFETDTRERPLPDASTVLPVVFFNDDNGCDGVPRITSQVLDASANTVTVTFEDGDGLTEIDFTLLNNLFVSDSDGFTSTNDATFTPPGAAPETAVFVVEQVDTSIPEGSFYVNITDGCAAGPEVYFADPVLRMGADAAVPAEFGLSAAYPNPFASRTVVPVDVAEASEVRVVIYDVLGRVVAVLVDGPMQPGRYEAVLDASGLAPGTYLVRMTATGPTAGGFSQTQRLTLVR